VTKACWKEQEARNVFPGHGCYVRTECLGHIENASTFDSTIGIQWKQNKSFIMFKTISR